ncbi:MAG: thiamine phosphate synthase [Gammaproteobacteria bacterium]
MNKLKSQLQGIHLIVNEHNWSKKIHCDIKNCIELGVKVFQFRFSKSFLLKVDKTKLQDSLILIRNVDGISLVNNHWELVNRFGFDGTHIGQSDGDPYLIKSILKDKIVGVSCYGYLGLALRAKDAYCDYVSFGAFAKSQTKSNASILSSEQFQKITSFRELPTALVGGINSNNLTTKIASNFDMIAISDGILGAQDVGKAVQDIHRIINR